jgi:hypothetical protein
VSDSNHSILVGRLKSHPVLCWMTNAHAGKPTIRLATSFVDGRFYTDSGEGFNFARELSRNDLQRYSLGYWAF